MAGLRCGRHQALCCATCSRTCFLLFGAAHLGQHQRLGVLADVPGHHHLVRARNRLELHAGQRPAARGVAAIASKLVAIGAVLA